jgi:hypothetical protein
MSKFTFICQEEPSPFNDEILSKRTVEFHGSHLEGIIGEFETFLKGCGFQFNGYLDIVQLNTESDEDDDLDDLDSIFGGKSLIKSDEC